MTIDHHAPGREDKATGRDAVRPYLVMYIGTMGSRQRNVYSRLFRRYGLVEEAARVPELYLDHRRDEAVRAGTDEMIDRVTISGPVAECRERLAEVAMLGFDKVAVQLTVPGGRQREIIDAITALAAEV
jgi:hypothetical protein